jgi:murein DD-endopeptidase MepM/ murein hydrolase activator NlpD
MSCSCHPEIPTQPRGLSRRMVVAGSLAAGSALLLPKVAGAAGTEPDPGLEGTDSGGAVARDYGFLPPRPASEVHVCDIMFPVLPDATLGKATWTDTYLAPRSSGRLHEGQDLMGKKMLKLLAVADCTIVELRHQSSGNSLYLRDDKTGWYYCYLHINNDDPGTDNAANQFKYAFAPGMAIGKKVLRGEHIAYLGDSGNAEATGAHCHFEIRMPNAKWYNAAAVNAKYSLNAADPAKLRAKVPNSAFAPLPNASAFATQQAVDFLGITPSAGWVSQSTTDLEGAVVGLDTFVANMLIHDGARKITAPTIRLYLGFFPGRIPDYQGLDYWIRKVRAGTPSSCGCCRILWAPEAVGCWRSVVAAHWAKVAMPAPTSPASTGPWTTPRTSRSCTATCSHASPTPVASTTGSAASTAAPSAAGSCVSSASPASSSAGPMPR